MRNISSSVKNITTNSNDNNMVGDISYEELSKIDGISTIALSAKRTASLSSVFRKTDTAQYVVGLMEDGASYKNVSVLVKFLTNSGRIIPTRTSGIKSRKLQRRIRRAIIRARFLGLLPYIKY